jgi:hypothetical protein
MDGGREDKGAVLLGDAGGLDPAAVACRRGPTIPQKKMTTVPTHTKVHGIVHVLAVAAAVCYSSTPAVAPAAAPPVAAPVVCLL